MKNMNETIKIIITDDHPLMRIGIKTMISGSRDMQVIGEASSGKQLLDMLQTLCPDIVLLDILMPDLSGIDTAKTVRKQYPDIKILMISSECDEETLLNVMNIGIDGFISKSQPASELHLAIHDIMQGNSYFGADLSMLIRDISLNKSASRDDPSIFSKKELEIIQLSCEGYLSKEIANKLNISPRTVEGHKAKIFKKLGLNTTVEMVRYAIRNKIISIV